MEKLTQVCERALALATTYNPAITAARRFVMAACVIAGASPPSQAELDDPGALMDACLPPHAEEDGAARHTGVAWARSYTPDTPELYIRQLTVRAWCAVRGLAADIRPLPRGSRQRALLISQQKEIIDLLAAGRIEQLFQAGVAR